MQDKSKPQKIGATVGNPSLLSEQNSDLLAQVAIWYDRANEGLTPNNIRNNMLRLQPELSFEQPKTHYHKTFLGKHVGRLKQKPVKAQKTSSKRSQCTVAQQFCWFTLVNQAFDFLRTHNLGVCQKTGKNFEEVIAHFIIGGDKTCLQADADGDVKIVGEFGCMKYEKKVSDCRASAAMHRTRTAGGSNGPTVFLMAGQRVRSGFSNQFLQEEGCEVGSSIQMTKNAFVTEAAWLAMTP